MAAVAGEPRSGRVDAIGPRSGRRRPPSQPGSGLELADEIVEVEALKLPRHGVELALAVFDEALALAAELERLPQLGLSGVEPLDDRLEPLDRGLVALGGRSRPPPLSGSLIVAHLHGTSSSAKRTRNRASLPERSAACRDHRRRSRSVTIA